MHPSFVRNWLVILALVLAPQSGCAPFEKESRSNSLNQSVRLYVDSIRWGNFDTAASLVRPRDGAAPAPSQNVASKIRVTGYASRIVSVNEERNEAEVITSFDYYSLNTAVVRKISRTDLWWFDTATERWYLDGSLPDFRP